ncbi:hypothetical protein DFP72DRAFT_850694 [Ephemerocybe angulata]|uniref:Uncharacterized protein n=1 Tax=Ephemerocybe angulata TaxID=980116 RepID=A0A8H6HQZ1_9AGAR|nr:hypothetical protein DFP72DRAFT_850694 [Tulosesus angulatus]
MPGSSSSLKRHLPGPPSAGPSRPASRAGSVISDVLASRSPSIGPSGQGESVGENQGLGMGADFRLEIAGLGGRAHFGMDKSLKPEFSLSQSGIGIPVLNYARSSAWLGS